MASNTKNENENENVEKHKTITFEGREIHYREEGREHRDTVVLLHGFLQNLAVWSSYTLTYMHSMHVVAIDLPGHGYSATYSDVHTMDFMANAVKTVLDKIGVEQCVIVGHSMGGYVALAFADRYRYMLKGLALINSHAMADDENKRRLRDEVCHQASQNRAGYIVDFITNLFYDKNRQYLCGEIKELRDQSLETTLTGIVAAQRGMKVRTSRIGVLAALTCPVLFVYGKKDERIDMEIGLSQAMLPTKSEVLMLDGVAHMSFLEEREYVKRRLGDFVHQCYTN